MALSLRLLPQHMARRRRKPDLIELIIPLVGIAAILCLISPQSRQIVSTLELIVVWLVVLAVLGLIGFGVYRFATRSQRANVFERKVDSKPLAFDVNVQEKQPQTTSNLERFK